MKDFEKEAEQIAENIVHLSKWDYPFEKRPHKENYKLWIIKALVEAEKRGRAEGIEAAAKVAECRIYKTGDPNEVCRMIAEAIRALADRHTEKKGVSDDK